jgi:hypothetical protein
MVQDFFPKMVKINGFRDGNEVPINSVEHTEVFTEKIVQFRLFVTLKIIFNFEY